MTTQRHCTLIAGPFASFIQGCLAVVCISILIIKRQQESPRRDWLVWFLDVLKQGVGASFGHVSNIYLSMIIAQSLMNTRSPEVAALALRDVFSKFTSPFSQSVATHFSHVAMVGDECQWYCLTYIVDSTFGTLWNLFCLQILECIVVQSPTLYRVLNFGNYGHPPSVNVFLAQLLVWLFIVITGKLMIVVMLYNFISPLNAVMNYLFQSLVSYPEIELVLVMIIIPAVLNTIQFWITDTFIKQQVPSVEDALPASIQASQSAPYERAEDLLFRSSDDEDIECEEEDEDEELSALDRSPSLLLKKSSKKSTRKRVIRTASPGTIPRTNKSSFEYETVPSSSDSSGSPTATITHQLYRIGRSLGAIGYSYARSMYDLLGVRYLFPSGATNSSSLSTSSLSSIHVSSTPMTPTTRIRSPSSGSSYKSKDLDEVEGGGFHSKGKRKAGLSASQTAHPQRRQVHHSSQSSPLQIHDDRNHIINRSNSRSEEDKSYE